MFEKAIAKNDIKLIEEQVQTISKDEILEVTANRKHLNY